MTEKSSALLCSVIVVSCTQPTHVVPDASRPYNPLIGAWMNHGNIDGGLVFRQNDWFWYDGNASGTYIQSGRQILLYTMAEKTTLFGIAELSDDDKSMAVISPLGKTKLSKVLMKYNQMHKVLPPSVSSSFNPFIGVWQSDTIPSIKLIFMEYDWSSYGNGIYGTYSQSGTVARLRDTVDSGTIRNLTATILENGLTIEVVYDGSSEKDTFKKWVDQSTLPTPSGGNQ